MAQAVAKVKAAHNGLKHILVLEFSKIHEISEIGNVCDCPQTDSQLASKADACYITETHVKRHGRKFSSIDIVTIMTTVIFSHMKMFGEKQLTNPRLCT